jgi:hypothetical protein
VAAAVASDDGRSAVRRCSPRTTKVAESQEVRLPGWKSVPAHYELSKKMTEEGLFPQMLKKGGKKIKFAGHGG